MLFGPGIDAPKPKSPRHLLRGPRLACKGQPGGKRLKGRPCLRWLNDVEEYLSRNGMKKWRGAAEDKDTRVL